MFVDYYDELSEFTNFDEARRAFGGAAEALALADGAIGRAWRLPTACKKKVAC